MENHLHKQENPTISDRKRDSSHSKLKASSEILKTKLQELQAAQQKIEETASSHSPKYTSDNWRIPKVTVGRMVENTKAREKATDLQKDINNALDSLENILHEMLQKCPDDNTNELRESLQVYWQGLETQYLYLNHDLCEDHDYFVRNNKEDEYTKLMRISPGGIRNLRRSFENNIFKRTKDGTQTSDFLNMPVLLMLAKEFRPLHVGESVLNFGFNAVSERNNIIEQRYAFFSIVKLSRLVRDYDIKRSQSLEQFRPDCIEFSLRSLQNKMTSRAFSKFTGNKSIEDFVKDIQIRRENNYNEFLAGSSYEAKKNAFSRLQAIVDGLEKMDLIETAIERYRSFTSNIQKIKESHQKIKEQTGRENIDDYLIKSDEELNQMNKRFQENVKRFFNADDYYTKQSFFSDLNDQFEEMKLISNKQGIREEYIITYLKSLTIIEQLKSTLTESSQREATSGSSGDDSSSDWEIISTPPFSHEDLTKAIKNFSKVDCHENEAEMVQMSNLAIPELLAKLENDLNKSYFHFCAEKRSLFDNRVLISRIEHKYKILNAIIKELDNS